MKPLVTILLYFLVLFTGQAQTVLTGLVADPAGVGIPGAYLFNHTQGTHTHTNELGYFSFDKVYPGDSLEINILGYQRYSWLVAEQDLASTLRITLKEQPFQLDQVTVSGRVNELNVITGIDLATQPVNSSQEILRKVPGLFIGQHAGGGKAEQIFLRGFDIDHGTDIAISVDGMPVNMVSHAHGQGYADLHFLIPETINTIDFGKGPYYADRGDFTTAGYVAFQTKDAIDQSSVSVDLGQFNTLRTVGLFNLLGNTERQHAYLATEFLQSDGAFASPQNFYRLNLMGKYSARIGEADQVSLLISRFQSQWDASGQIPQRAVDRGLIGRFGAIDDTEGGQTSRTNLLLSYTHFLNNQTFVKSKAYYTRYDFDLYSNFTFFLDDPINGDQIRQQENRTLVGAESVWQKEKNRSNGGVQLRAGAGFRFDLSTDNELSHTRNRTETLIPLALGDIQQQNLYAFAQVEWRWGRWRLSPGLRFDQFRFTYQDQLTPAYDPATVSRGIISPKFNVVYAPRRDWQFFLKTGRGFHSNDARVVIAQQGRQVLPAAYGADLGTIWKPTNRLLLNGALWVLYLDQEFVYVGDAGIVEPSGETRRIGVDAGLRYELSGGFFLDGDINYTYARSIDPDAAPGARFIPLAPDLTATAGLSYTGGAWTAGIRSRYLKSRPANEDASIIAEGYWITDANVQYTTGPVSLGLIVENVFNSAWNETQFATESRLADELDPVEEIHFIPGTPFFVKGRITLRF
ncbi:MAG: TonB-dependent receptor plug domain-containing protein [Lewinellaceae bacterium]|nr:TonB-dependent receptor plug domain-containing protein [Lewinellaceae bacterium]